MPPPKGGSAVWDNAEFLNEVIIGLYEAGTINKGFTPASKSIVQEYLASQGHQVTWEAIRQHVQKLRKARDVSAFKNASGANTPVGTPSKAPKTPASGKKTPAKKGEKTPRKRAKTEEDLGDDEEFKNELGQIKSEDFDDSPRASPAKRAKKEPVNEYDEQEI